MRDDGPPGSPPGPRSAGRADWYNKTSAASIGIEMAVAICGGALGGLWVERHWTHWAPWTTLIGLMIGIGAAGLAIARLVREHERDVAARRAAEEAPDARSAGLPPVSPPGDGPGAPPGGVASLPKAAPRSGDHETAGAGAGAGAAEAQLADRSGDLPGEAGAGSGPTPATPRRQRAAPLPARGPLP